MAIFTKIKDIDIKKCFDEMWFEGTLNDLYDMKVNNDKFALLTELNKDGKVKVKTPCGITEQFEIKEKSCRDKFFGPINAQSKLIFWEEMP